MEISRPLGVFECGKHVEPLAGSQCHLEHGDDNQSGVRRLCRERVDGVIKPRVLQTLYLPQGRPLISEMSLQKGRTSHVYHQFTLNTASQRKAQPPWLQTVCWITLMPVDEQWVTNHPRPLDDSALLSCGYFWMPFFPLSTIFLLASRNGTAWGGLFSFSSLPPPQPLCTTYFYIVTGRVQECWALQGTSYRK